jgi:hypothetical protein
MTVSTYAISTKIILKYSIFELSYKLQTGKNNMLQKPDEYTIFSRYNFQNS